MKIKKTYIMIIAIILVLIIITILFFINSSKQSSYKIISSIDKKEFEYAKQKCEKIIQHLENKYNEKFHITYKWYFEEFSRLSEIEAYSYKNPNNIFKVSEDIYGINDNYITVLAKNDVFNYFYNIFSKYNIDKNDFSVTYYEVNSLEICKECFDEEQSIHFSIFLDNNEFSDFEKRLSDISINLNKSISYENSYKPNFYINLYTKENVNYNNTISDDNYVFISIYNNHYKAHRVHSFPEDLFNCTYTEF